MKIIKEHLPKNVRRELINSYGLSEEHQEQLIASYEVAEAQGFEKCKQDILNAIKIMEIGRYSK